MIVVHIDQAFLPFKFRNQEMHVFQNTLHVILQDATDTRASILLSQETS